jgi:hypothetical protein
MTHCKNCAATGTAGQEVEKDSPKGTALCLSSEAHGTARLPEMLEQWAREDAISGDGPDDSQQQPVTVRRVCVPMSNGVDSLNVATAGAILMHQLGGAKLTWE